MLQYEYYTSTNHLNFEIYQKLCFNIQNNAFKKKITRYHSQ